MIRYVKYLVALLLLSSCASFNAPLDYRLDSKSNRGLVVFSFTTKGILDNFFLQYQKDDLKEKGDITLWTNKNPLDWSSTFKGRLIVLDLSEGNYEIFRLIAPLDVASHENFSIPFEVIPGKVTYLGNVHVKVPNRVNYNYTVKDESERDLALLFSRYTQLSRNDLVKLNAK